MPNLPNLSGSNIQDTYQRVLHTDGTLVYNGTGSVVSNMPTTASFAITASHAISASHEITFELSSSHAQTADSASYILASNIDQPFTNITASSNISASGNIFGSQYYTKGQVLGLYHEGSSTIRLADTSNKTRIDGTNIKLDAPVTASGDISASGDITAGIITANGLTGFISKGFNIGNYDTGLSKITLGYSTNTPIEIGKGTPNIKINGDITASGNISSSGTIIANKIESDNLFNHVGDANTGVQLGLDTVTLQGNDVNIGVFATNRIELNKSVTASSDISASGTGSFGHLETSGHLYMTEAKRISFGDSPTTDVGDQFIAGYEDYLIIDGDDNIRLITDNAVRIPARLGIGDAYDSIYNTVPASLSVDGNIFTLGSHGHITASGNISSSGNIIEQEQVHSVI